MKLSHRPPIRRGLAPSCTPHHKPGAFTCPVVESLNTNATAIASLTRQLFLKRTEAGAFQRTHAMLLDEVTRLIKNIPTVASVSADSRRRPPSILSVPALEDISTTERTIDPSEILIRRGAWTRFDYGDRIAVAPQYTHRIMPGTYHVLASDGIRAIITPADAPDRARTVVHTTNLRKVRMDIDLSSLGVKTAKPRRTATPPTYDISDLI